MTDNLKNQAEKLIEIHDNLGFSHLRREAILQDIALGIARLTDSVEQTQRRGRWVKSLVPDSILCACSRCDFSCGSATFNYCPMCGAKMKDEE